ncbi:MAG: divalent-cation tolerance protein CutA [Candidatus Thermoplasmatota archaeon]|jgi:periplasmic divalent cation tolerance protein|nr:divalent-cation tolerance protein CutA [Candidatus Thermoplasmatota archaeon]
MKIVMTTVSKLDEAELLSRSLVDNGYSPCVNMIENVSSVYFWKGKITRDQEIILLIKTDIPENVKQFIEKEHPYETPEIIFLEGEIPDSPYGTWFNEYFSVNRQ